MVCDTCGLFPGNPCDCCRTASRVNYILQSKKLHLSVEAKALEALRFCAGALTDLVEDSSRLKRAEKKAGVASPGREEAKAEEAEEESTGIGSSTDRKRKKGDESKDKKEKKRSKEAKVKKESAEEGKKESHKKEKNRQEVKKEEEAEEVKEEPSEEAGAPKEEEESEEAEARGDETPPLRSEEGPATANINERIEAHPREYGLRTWGVSEEGGERSEIPRAGA